MSENFGDLHFSDAFLDHNQRLCSISNYALQGFGSSEAMDYEFSLATAFGLSPSSSEVFSSIDRNLADAGETGHLNANEISGTPNSSVSFSSNSDAEEDSGKTSKEKTQRLKETEDVGEASKTQDKSKKKGERKEREPRFAFMTKSEVDHLEDGYRWRKYGQKAVKNSAYPRSYYRCTTQKCGVKKRVERSFEDPSMVITTYEGQHNHPIPATLRGNLSAAATFPPSMLTPMPVVGSGGFLPELFRNSTPTSNQVAGGGISGGSVYSHGSFSCPNYQQPADYGLLQDIFPASSFFNRPP